VPDTEGLGRTGGVPVDTPMGEVIDFSDGKTSRACVYLDYREALRSAGLS
jgi:hypothetical protein